MRRRLIVTGAAVLLFAALAGGGVAWATRGDDDGESVRGPAAERARDAALEHVGGGRVVGVEREEEGAAWEVEVVRADGSGIEVLLDAGYRVVAAGADEEHDDSDGSEDGE